MKCEACGNERIPKKYCPNCKKISDSIAEYCDICSGELAEVQYCPECKSITKVANNNYSDENKADNTTETDEKAVTPKNTGKASGIFGKLTGIFSIIMGIVVFTKDIGYYEMNMKYGGDAYTGIQNAAAATANNIRYLASITKLGLGALLVSFGLFLIIHFSNLNSQN